VYLAVFRAEHRNDTRTHKGQLSWKQLPQGISADFAVLGMPLLVLLAHEQRTAQQLQYLDFSVEREALEKGVTAFWETAEKYKKS
jgi:hypothetical protein